MLSTSSDPEVVAMIHEHGQRTIDELAGMEARYEKASAEAEN
jgi:hypothetical protein